MPSPPPSDLELTRLSTVMTNFHDPKVVQSDGLAFIKLFYVAAGIYIWEFLTSMWFDWQVITKKRPHRWSIWLYSGCRVSAMFSIITTFIGFNVTTPLNCRVWLVIVLFFSYSSFVFASALIVLRIVAIWERDRIVCTIAIATWLVNIAFYIRNMIWSEAVWNTEQATCLVIKTNRNLIAIVVTLGEDLVLLILMLTGLRRYRDVGMYGLWGLLHRQGLLWLVLVVVAEIPTTVFNILNLNDYLNLMLQTPELIMMTIGASRIYRSLADYSGMVHFDWGNERGYWSFHGIAASRNPSTLEIIQFNSFTDTHSALSNSRSQSQSRTHPHYEEPHRPRLYSLTSTRPQAVRFPMHSRTYPRTTREFPPPIPIVTPQPSWPELALCRS